MTEQSNDILDNKIETPDTVMKQRVSRHMLTLEQTTPFEHYQIFHLVRGLHQGQLRWEREDYINHPYRIAINVQRFTHNHKGAIRVALAHDALEDTCATEELLINYLSEEELGWLKQLTRADDVDYARYLDNILHGESDIPIIIKMFDAWDNSTLTDEDKAFVTSKGRDWREIQARYLRIANQCGMELIQRDGFKYKNKVILALNWVGHVEDIRDDIKR